MFGNRSNKLLKDIKKELSELKQITIDNEEQTLNLIHDMQRELNDHELRIRELERRNK